MLQLTRRYLRQIDGIFLALCAACSALSVVTLVSIGHNQLGSINKASVQFIASALGILLALIVSTVDYRALARAWPLHAVLAWGMVLPTLLLHNVRLGFLTVGYDAGGTSNYSWYRVGGMTFQPAELAKISFVLTLALHLNHVRGRVNKPANLLALAVHVLLPVLAIPDGHQPGHEPAGVARDWCDLAVFLGGRVERGDDVLLRRPGAECGFAGAAQPCGCSGNLVRSALFAFAGIAHAQAGDQAERGQPNQDEHGTGQPGQRAAQQPAHGVKAPDAVDAPVDAADNGQQQQNLFEYGHKNPSLYASMARWGGIYT